MSYKPLAFLFFVLVSSPTDLSAQLFQCFVDECSTEHEPVCDDQGITHHNLCHAQCIGATIVNTDCTNPAIQMLVNCPGVGIEIGDPPINPDASFYWTPNFDLDCYDCPFVTVNPLGTKVYTRREYIIDGGAFGPLNDLVTGVMSTSTMDAGTGGGTGSSTGLGSDTDDGITTGSYGNQSTSTPYYGPYHSTTYVIEPDWSCSENSDSEFFQNQYEMCNTDSTLNISVGVEPEGGVLLVQGPANGSLETGGIAIGLFDTGYIYTPSQSFIGTDTVFYAITFLGVPVAVAHVYVDVLDCSIVSPGTSVFHPEYEDPKVFPNPSDGLNELTISNVPPGNYAIDILDVNGQRIQSISKESTDSSLQVKLKDLNAGIYFIRLSNESALFSQKILVQ